MNNQFILEYDKFNLHNDITEFVNKITKNINFANIKKRHFNIIWYLTNVLEILNNYEQNEEYKNLNLLEDESYKKLLISIKKLINTQYYVW